MAQRIQLSRRKGWRKPEGVIVVSRPTMWGNPFTVESAMNAGYAQDEADARAFCVECYRDWVEKAELSEWWYDRDQEKCEWIRKHVFDLAGADLACWCPLDRPCHADVLLEIANRRY